MGCVVSLVMAYYAKKMIKKKVDEFNEIDKLEYEDAVEF